MGVTGSGKTTVGQELAAVLHWPFFDADVFHSPANIAKMSSGIPLTDADRMPWLMAISEAINNCLGENQNAVFACSALKAAYRNILHLSESDVKLVYLQGDFNLLYRRLQQRQNHFMKPDMLRSQLDTLEEPTPQEALYVNVGQTLEAIVHHITTTLGL
ncbi:gluconokinase [[Phormidium] sp. ETS-05]|uniref:gluconokinase n=1 Tax=[Phormidium] sp. ETS-05 TaxID=222819 RepID=UPI001E63F1B2|nr:gluconokinase [[Phormidium] sp. ETS-05]